MTQDGIHHVVDRGMPITRHDLPLDRLEVVAVRQGTRADHKQMPADWLVMECLDDDEKVWIACHEGEMRFVEQAFGRSSRPPQSTLP
ncbi:hypothetical protein [Pengzhenrongella sicca]|uniref:Uncharacterized protein n=1 Tax=Pengzhenrongella sicca TaxID=2819238 RepID=A0A8A4ZIL0_9MICO|nr:hypothetical protein [Pengzhenrongella sicca]QTE31105.1 hypothetical protein J4E96_09375 [Pengzhenrongella sicca]